MSDRLLTVDGLETHVETADGQLRAVDGVDFAVDRGETVCLVGQSGCGKSLTCRSLTRLLPPEASIEAGRIDLAGTDLTTLSHGELRGVRGDRIANVFQQPRSVIDPVYTVGEQIVEAIRLHRSISAEEARARAVETLRQVGIPAPGERLDDYPHQFSGGMLQRVALAIALAPEPDLLVADEPTTSVDVTVQARLIRLLAGLQATRDLSILLVTHDLRVVSALADRVVVMYAGTIVERGSVERVFERPAHPYTQALFEQFDGRLDRSHPAATATEAMVDREDVPADGCRFRPECPHAVSDCAGGAQPAFRPAGGQATHEVSCVYYGPDHDAAPLVQRGHRVGGGAGGDRDRSGGDGAGGDGAGGDEAGGAGGERAGAIDEPATTTRPADSTGGRGDRE